MLDGTRIAPAVDLGPADLSGHGDAGARWIFSAGIETGESPATDGDDEGGADHGLDDQWEWRWLSTSTLPVSSQCHGEIARAVVVGRAGVAPELCLRVVDRAGHDHARRPSDTSSHSCRQLSRTQGHGPRHRGDTRRCLSDHLEPRNREQSPIPTSAAAATFRFRGCAIRRDRRARPHSVPLVATQAFANWYPKRAPGSVHPPGRQSIIEVPSSFEDAGPHQTAFRWACEWTRMNAWVASGNCWSNRPPSCWLFGLAPNQSRADQVGMAYIIERSARFYVVAYDGADPQTGRERRHWYPAGRSRTDAEAIAERITATRRGERIRPTSALTVSAFLLDTWMPRRDRELRPSTARRYEWMIRNYITPVIGDHRLNALRPEHLNRLYVELLDQGGAGGRGLALKTVYDVHIVIRSALHDARRRHLVDHNVALDTRPPRATTRSRRSPRSGPPNNSPTSSPRQHICACTRRCTSQRPPGYVAASSPDCAGATGSDRPTDCPLLAAARAFRARRSRCRPRPQPAADASTSTTTPNRSSNAGGAGNPATATPSPSTTQSSPTLPVRPCTQSRSPSSSTGRRHASVCPASGSTISATPTHRSSSPMTSRSRSCPNGSATHTPGSRWPPTNTCCRDWEPAPPPASPRSSRPHVTIASQPLDGHTASWSVDDLPNAHHKHPGQPAGHRPLGRRRR
jgi:hypothetical protein